MQTRLGVWSMPKRSDFDLHRTDLAFIEIHSNVVVVDCLDALFDRPGRKIEARFAAPDARLVLDPVDLFAFYRSLDREYSI